MAHQRLPLKKQPNQTRLQGRESTVSSANSWVASDLRAHNRTTSKPFGVGHIWNSDPAMPPLQRHGAIHLPFQYSLFASRPTGFVKPTHQNQQLLRDIRFQSALAHITLGSRISLATSQLLIAFEARQATLRYFQTTASR